MTVRWVALQLYPTVTQPCTCLACRMEGSANARCGLPNCDAGIAVNADQ